MAKKNMFDEYILDKDTEDESQDLTDGDKREGSESSVVVSGTDGSGQTKEYPEGPPQSKLNFPATLLPWDGRSDAVELTQKLVNGGYTTLKMLATATPEEVVALTDLPQEYVSRLVSKAKEWFEFNFETAAQLLGTRQLFRKIPTGSTKLDELLGGGIEPKSITEFYGEFTSGKTQLCMQLSVNTVLPRELGGLDADVIYIDTEGSFRPERVVQMVDGLGVSAESVLNRIFVGRAHNTNIQMQLTNNILKLAEDRDVRLIIVDSLTSNFRAEFVGKGSLVDRQQKLNQHVQQLSRISDLLGAAIVVTNQVLSVVDGFEKAVVPVGGNILAHGTTHRIHLQKSKRGSTTRQAKLVASPSLPEREAFFKVVQSGIKDVSRIS